MKTPLSPVGWIKVGWDSFAQPSAFLDHIYVDFTFNMAVQVMDSFEFDIAKLTMEWTLSGVNTHLKKSQWGNKESRAIKKGRLNYCICDV